MKRTKSIFCLMALAFIVTLIVCLSIPAVVLAADGEEVAPAPSNGELIRNWIYEKGDALAAGLSSSALIGSICAIALAVIKKRLVNKLSDNSKEQSVTLSEVKLILSEAKAIRGAVESDVTRLKALRRTEAVEAVEQKAAEITEEITVIESTETEAEDEAVLRS